MLALLKGLLFFTITANFAQATELYQVTSSHPHDVKHFSPYIETVKQEGRLWIVKLKGKVPASAMKHLRSVKGRDLRSYLVDAKSLKREFPVSTTVKDYASRINVSEIRKDVEVLSAFRNRAAGSEENKKAAEFIRNEFASLGYTVKTECYKKDACSVIADKAGSDSSNEFIMIMAHFDSVGRDFAGADDNGSGTAVLLEVARVLQTYSNNKRIRFFATNGEELGLLGAKHHAKALEASGEIKKLVLAINMDMVGYNANGIVELETDSKYEGLANWFAQLTASYTSLKTKITLGAWGSDHVPFIERNVPTLLTIEDWSTKTPCYHQSCDKPETLNYVYAGEIAKLNLAAIMTRDSQ